eukprot:scaffold24119_cov21-Phaeocystis_antarctica.AAC.1
MDYQRVLRGSQAIPMRHHLTTVPLARRRDGGGWRVGISRTVYTSHVSEHPLFLPRSRACTTQISK